MLVGLIGLAVGVIGTAITFLAYQQAHRRKMLGTTIHQFAIVDDAMSSIEGLAITFEGREVPNVVAATLLLVNLGVDTIDMSDFAAADPLRLSLRGDGVVLSTRVITQAAASMSARITLTNDREAAITFDYLQPLGFLTLSCLHTSRLEDGLTISGMLKTGSIKAWQPSLYSSVEKFVLRPIAVILLTFLIASLAASRFTQFDERFKMIAIVAAALGVLVSAGGTFLSYRATKLQKILASRDGAFQRTKTQ